MNFFLDTSSLVKIYHKELGSDKIIELYQSSEQLLISELAIIELYSTFHRKFREKEISLQTLNILLEKFEDDIDFRYSVLKFSSLIFDNARDFLRRVGTKYGLRTLDSIQFAFFSTYCEKEDIFVCFDKKFLNIIKKQRYRVFNLE